MSTVNLNFGHDQEGTAAVFSNWLKQAGDPVEAHEPVAEIETDKVVVEVAAPSAGRLATLLKQPGDSLEPGDLIGTLETEEQNPQESTADVQQTIPTTNPEPLEPLKNGKRPRLSPAVRRLLKEYGLDATDIAGSGRAGRVTVRDVNKHLQHQNTSPPIHPVNAPGGQINSHRIPLDPMRRSIASHMVDSLLKTAPHVTTVFEVDMSRVLAHRNKHKQTYQDRGIKLTLTAYFIQACVKGIQKVPLVNSRFGDDHIEVFDDINIGLATALGDKGLVVPVIRNTQSQNLMGTAQAVQQITDRARNRQLGSSDMAGGTFTISNHGVSGSLTASPIIINQPQSAILGIGKLQKRVVVEDKDGTDVMAIRPMCFLTLTLDHRVLDAYQANGFLSEVVNLLENWED